MYGPNRCGQMQAEKIAAGVLNGDSQSAIAASIGMSQPTVSRAISKDVRVKRLIEDGVQVITDVLPKALDNIKYCVESFKNEMPKDYGKAELQMREFGFKASERVMSLVGLGDSHSQAPAIQQIFIQQNNNYFSPVVDRALSAAIVDIDPQDVATEA